MSVDWRKYSTPEQTRQRNVRDPARYGVVSLNVAETRALELAVSHEPRDWNRAHSHVNGDVNNAEIRKALARLANIEIPVPPEQPQG